MAGVCGVSLLNVVKRFVEYKDCLLYTSVEEVFRICSTRTRGKSVFVIEGIRYTPQLSALWKRMKQDGRAGITFDRYDLGIIFFDKTKIKQDYIVNF